MVYFTLADAPRIQTIPFYISNPLRNLALVKDNKDDTPPSPSKGTYGSVGL